MHVFVPIVIVIPEGLQFGSGYKRARRVEREALYGLSHMDDSRRQSTCADA